MASADERVARKIIEMAPKAHDLLRYIEPLHVDRQFLQDPRFVDLRPIA